MTNSNICSKQHRLIQLYSYETHTLQQELQNRLSEKKHFGWKEIWSILCSTVLGMAHLTKNEILHYTLSLQDLILTDQGSIKILPLELSEYMFDYNVNS